MIAYASVFPSGRAIISVKNDSGKMRIFVSNDENDEQELILRVARSGASGELEHVDLVTEYFWPENLFTLQKID